MKCGKIKGANTAKSFEWNSCKIDTFQSQIQSCFPIFGYNSSASSMYCIPRVKLALLSSTFTSQQCCQYTDTDPVEQKMNEMSQLLSLYQQHNRFRLKCADEWTKDGTPMSRSVLRGANICQESEFIDPSLVSSALEWYETEIGFFLIDAMSWPHNGVAIRKVSDLRCTVRIAGIPSTIRDPDWPLCSLSMWEKKLNAHKAGNIKIKSGKWFYEGHVRAKNIENVQLECASNLWKLFYLGQNARNRRSLI